MIKCLFIYSPISHGTAFLISVYYRVQTSDTVHARLMDNDNITQTVCYDFMNKGKNCILHSYKEKKITYYQCSNCKSKVKNSVYFLKKKRAST